jgi:uncharacterized protein (DUF488 family)
MKKPIFTLGHSNLSSKDFLQILHAFHVDIVIDIRKVTQVKSQPQFGKTRIKQSLKRAKIEYVQFDTFENILDFVHDKTVALLSAESVPETHRNMIADFLVDHGFQVFEISNEKLARPYKISDSAEIDHLENTYPAH